MKERNYYCHLKNDKKIWKYLSVHAIISCIFSYYIKIEKKIGLGNLCVETGIEVNRETASIAIKMERKGIGGVAKQLPRGKTLLPESTSCVCSIHTR